jgi:hypothetical protein
MTSRFVVGLTLFGLVCVVRAQAEPLSATCPEYTAQLLKARAALARQDRPRAIAALRNAQAALTACEETDTGDASEVDSIAASPMSLDPSVGLSCLA